jgi:D-arabinose 1-dehydrogenase-like Zn-dependent alcohol dehydrogenase
VAIGSACTKIKVGMKVGVGCLVDSCLKCSACLKGEEQHCMQAVPTYGGNDNGSGRAASPCGYTLGGYTSKMVVVSDLYGSCLITQQLETRFLRPCSYAPYRADRPGLATHARRTNTLR